MSSPEEIFTFAAQQQTEAYNRIAAYKEKQAANELLKAQTELERAQFELAKAKQKLRPSLTILPCLLKEGSMWMAKHGGCEGVGATPELAYQDFDANWVGKHTES